MSALGMTRTALATELAEAIAKDAAAGTLGLVSAEFGPNVRVWLEEVARAVAMPSVQTQAASGFSGDTLKLAEGIASAAQRAGIYNGEVGLSVPHLLQLLDDMSRSINQGPRHAMDHLVEEIAKEWDGCIYDAVGESIDVGGAIRAKKDQLLRKGEASQPSASELRELQPDELRDRMKVVTPEGQEVEVWNISADHGVRCSNGQWYCASELLVRAESSAAQQPRPRQGGRSA